MTEAVRAPISAAKRRAWIVAAVLVFGGVALPVGHYAAEYSTERATFQVAADQRRRDVAEIESYLALQSSALAQGDLESARVFSEMRKTRRLSGDEAIGRFEPVIVRFGVFLLLGGLATMTGFVIVTVTSYGLAIRGAVLAGLGAAIGPAACLGVLMIEDTLPKLSCGIGRAWNHLTDAEYAAWFIAYGVVGMLTSPATRRLVCGASKSP